LSGGAAAGFGPFLVGSLVWAIGLSLGATTGYAINPARDFGPRLAHAVLPIAGKGGSDWAYSWIPIVGPVIGAASAGGVPKHWGLDRSSCDRHDSLVPRRLAGGWRGVRAQVRPCVEIRTRNTVVIRSRGE
jgi:hypothetical protein